MAKESLFLDQSRPAKASVVLRLRSSGPLPAATVKAIAGLVSGSVESLRPESVVILDTYGRALSRPPEEAAEAATGLSLERQQQIERDLTQRVVSLLEPVVGAGRVRVNVAAVLAARAVEETEERWDPETVVRSRQTVSETSGGLSATGGVAGSRANLPPPAMNVPPAAGSAAAANATAKPDPAAAPPAAQVASAGAGPGRTSETTNYEVGRLTRHTVIPQGQIARLSVAVVLDDERVVKPEDGAVSTRPWEPEQLQRFHNLVAAAVGFDTNRGDQLMVENIAYDAPPAATDPAPLPVGQQVTDFMRQHWVSALRGLGIVVIALVALFGVLRPMARRATAAVPAALPADARGEAGRLPTVQEMEGRIDAGLDGSAALQPQRLPVLAKRVARLANDEPENLARIVRGWMTEGER
jgi:flagellar M-ring protein FliF